METKYFTITALNKAIKNMFDEKRELNNIHLKGEISNFKHHTRGHLYFTLKDETSQLSAIMFSYNAKNLNFTLYNCFNRVYSVDVKQRKGR